MVFWISSESIPREGDSIPKEKAREMLRNGENILPQKIKETSFDDKHKCTILIYHFEQNEVDNKAILLETSPISGIKHFTCSKLQEAIENRQP